jgi:hypothetical protein
MKIVLHSLDDDQVIIDELRLYHIPSHGSTVVFNLKDGSTIKGEVKKLHYNYDIWNNTEDDIIVDVYLENVIVDKL